MTSTKRAARKQPEAIPEIEVTDFDWAIAAGGALTVAQLDSDDPMSLDFTISPAL
jgi:hypothetical protein